LRTPTDRVSALISVPPGFEVACVWRDEEGRIREWSSPVYLWGLSERREVIPFLKRPHALVPAKDWIFPECKWALVSPGQARSDVLKMLRTQLAPEESPRRISVVLPFTPEREVEAEDAATPEL
jgi:hypothetical protein